MKHIKTKYIAVIDLRNSFGSTAQVDVIPYMDMNKIFTENYTLLDTSILIPNEYLIDVKVNFGMESIIHHNILKFKIVDDTKNKYN